MGIRLNQYRLATDTAFGGVVEAAVMHASNQILQEDPSTHGHEERTALARTFLLPDVGNRGEYLTRFVWVAAMNPTVQMDAMAGEEIDIAAIDDTDVDYIVASTWDMIAGVMAQEA